MAHRRRLNSDGNEEQETDDYWAPVVGAVFGAIAGAVSAFAAPAAANAILDSTGFTEKGIAGKSFASSVQSTANGTGRVSKHSIFSRLQSKGARGGFESPDPLTVLKCAAIGAGIGGGVGEIARREGQDRRNQ